MTAPVGRRRASRGKDSLNCADYSNFLPRVWYPALASFGLPKVGVHVLRHSAAARMIAAGAGPKQVQVVLGHSDPGFTLRVYGHLFPDDLDALAARIESGEGGREGGNLEHLGRASEKAGS